MAANREDGREIVNPFAGRDVNWLLDFRAETRPDHPFLVWEPFEGQGAVWTYRAFRDRVLRVAAGLARRGIRAGDYALVHLDNSPEMEFLWFACGRLGLPHPDFQHGGRHHGAGGGRRLRLRVAQAG